jgi:hypothetical protein
LKLQKFWREYTGNALANFPSVRWQSPPAQPIHVKWVAQLLAAALCESPKQLYCRGFYSSGQSRWAVKLSAPTNAISETCSIGEFGREIIFAGAPMVHSAADGYSTKCLVVISRLNPRTPYRRNVAANSLLISGLTKEHFPYQSPKDADDLGVQT